MVEGRNKISAFFNFILCVILFKIDTLKCKIIVIIKSNGIFYPVKIKKLEEDKNRY